jgi:hypothetical protein
VITTVDVGPGDATCKHNATIPAGGFTVPVFCIPALGFTSLVEAQGCESGNADGNGTVWDADADCPDADISRVGDTSDPDGNSCGTLSTGCTITGAGVDTGGNINTTRGNGVCDTVPGVHTQLDIPVLSTTWNDVDGACPDTDGHFDAGTDTLVTLFTFVLSPTTGSANADFSDLNGDACAFAGNGPDHTKHCSNDLTKPCTLANRDCGTGVTCVDGALVGIPPAGPCCVPGQQTTVVATGLAFTGGAPLYDLHFANSTPASISACSAVQQGTCTLTTNPCLD